LITFYGPIYDVTGYATASRSIIRLLADCGYDIGVIPNNSWSIYGIKLSQPDHTLFDRLVVNTIQSNSNIYSMQTLTTTSNVKGKKLVHTMFETDRCPDSWVNNLNQADYIFLPSDFGVHNFRRSGVKNCFYFPFYIDTEKFNPETKKLITRPEFKFLFMGDATPRKNLDMVLISFLNTFRDKNDVSLTIKIFINDLELSYFCDRISKVRKKMGVNKYPYIYLYPQILSNEVIPGFINSFDCLVAPSSGEGFGLPQLLSMASGKPIISPMWSAMMDYINNDNALLLHYDIKEVPYDIVKIDKNFYGHQWAWPSLEHLSLLMKWASDHPVECNTIGIKARETVIQKYSKVKVASILDSIFKEIGVN